MILRCIANNGKALGPRGPGAMMHRETSEYPLIIGETYPVYAMMLYNTTLGALIVNRYGGPQGVPIGLFEVIDPRVPDDWEFGLFDEKPGIPGRFGRQAVWGYHDFVASDTHYNLLLDGDPEERRRFAVEVARRNHMGPDSVDRPGK